MNLKQIDAFRAAMLSGSLTQAAQHLHVSQPSITRLIHDLEDSIGFKLFERSKGNKITPTVDAELFYIQVERSFAGLSALRKTAENIYHFKGGSLRIASLPALGIGFLPKVIQSFRVDYPEVTIQLQIRSSSTVRQWVANKQFELGLARPGSRMEHLEMEPLSSVKGVCVLPPGHSLANKEVIHPVDLDGENFISLADEDKTRHLIDDIFATAGVQRNLVIETQYGATICSLVLEGVGVSVVSPYVAQDYKDRGLIIKPFAADVVFDYMLFLPAGRPPSRLATAFVAKINEFLMSD